MALNQNAVGKTSDPVAFEYGWKDVVLYALGVGCKADELDFLYEGRGPKVLPTFAVVPSFQSMISVVNEVGANPMMVVHGEQQIVLHRPIPPAAKLFTSSTVKAVYDKGKGALIVAEAKTTNDQKQPIFDNIFSIFVRGEGGFGGARGPEAVKSEPPTGIAPDFEVIEATTREQALLYRLCGDPNPLHADPDFAKKAGFEKPILHGLCTYGHAGRAILTAACKGDPTRFRSFSARFSAPVLPGDTLITRGWKDGARYIITTSTQDGRAVLSNAIAEVG